MRLDHGAAAAGVAADGVDADRVVSRKQPSRHQGAQQGDGAGRVAAWVGDAGGAGDALGLPLLQFRHAVNPVGVDAVGGAGIQQLRRPTAQGRGEGGGFPCGFVMQAEDREVHLAHHVLPRRRILAVRRVDRSDGDAGHVLQALPDAQPRGPGFTIDEHAVAHAPASWTGWWGRLPALRKGGRGIAAVKFNAPVDGHPACAKARNLLRLAHQSLGAVELASVLRSRRSNTNQAQTKPVSQKAPPVVEALLGTRTRRLPTAVERHRLENW